MIIFFQMTPSQYLYDISLDTEKKFASQQRLKMQKLVDLSEKFDCKVVQMQTCWLTNERVSHDLLFYKRNV